MGVARPFLVVGAMKCGTTSLFELLARHPAVDLVADKERSALADPGLAPMFATQVRDSKAEVAGEVTAGYMQLPSMPQPLDEARRLLSPKDLRVVAIVREPVSRALSHWEHVTQLGRESRQAAAAILEPGSDYVAFSRYHHQLSGWADLVGVDRVLVLRMEDLRQSPTSTADRLFSFLGVSPLPADRTRVHANAGSARAVASGWRAGISRSPAYRKVLRPVLGPRVRRAALTLVGGGSGRVVGHLDPAEVREVRARLAPDLEQLQRRWPEARWP